MILFFHVVEIGDGCLPDGPRGFEKGCHFTVERIRVYIQKHVFTLCSVSCGGAATPWLVCCSSLDRTDF